MVTAVFTTPLRIELCGGLAVSAAGRRIDRQLSGHQGRAVLAYLLVHRTRAVERSELINLLWPENAPRDPDSALNTVLARLRRAVGQGVLGGRRQIRLELPEGSVVDIDLAEAAAQESDGRLEAGDTDAALDAGLRGAAEVDAPFLPDAGSWVAVARAQVEDLRARLLLSAARCSLMLGGARLADGAWAGRRLIEAEPYRESGYGALMEIHAARGDVAEAMMVYEQLRARLASDLGIAPSPQLAQLHQSLLDGPAVSPVIFAAPSRPDTRVSEPVALPLPRALARERRDLSGRSRESRVLRQAWRTAGEEEAHVVAIEGEAGAGKTALLRSLARKLHAEGATPLYGCAIEHPMVPCAPLVEALRAVVVHDSDLASDPRLAPHLGELGWLFPELSEHRAPADTDGGLTGEARRYQAVAALLAHATANGPALVALDDMHLADADTCALLLCLMREPSRHAILWAVSYRGAEVDADHPLSHLLDDAQRDPGLTRLPVEPVHVDAVESQAAPSPVELVPAAPAAMGEWLARLRPATREAVEVAALLEHSPVPEIARLPPDGLSPSGARAAMIRWRQRKLRTSSLPAIAR
jgi:DNA-binding SARP family transcriptional activator